MSLSLVESVMNDLDQNLPKCNPLYLLIAASFAPILIFSVLVCIRTCASYSREDESFSQRYFYYFFQIIKRFSWLIFLLNLILWLIVSAIQSVYVYNTMLVGTDVTYYLTVDLPVFDANNAINTATTTYSFNVITTQSYLDRSHYPVSKTKKIAENIRIWKKNKQSRSLQSSTSTISIVYHDDNWDNLVTNNHLITACLTERNILHNVDCLLTTNYQSIIAASFNISSCDYLTSFNDIAPNFALADNNYFVQDNPGSTSSPNSAIIISYFEVGTCDEISLQSLGNVLNDQGVNGMSIVYVNSQMVSQAFSESILNSITLSIYALILCTIFFVLCIRGFIVAIVTLLTMIIATANAAALLPLWGYGYFSAFNIMSLFILLGVGVNSVILFGSAWRKYVTPGALVTVKMLQETYTEIAVATLFTTVAAMLSLFSKLASPVIVISQLGAFMGVAVLVFYILLHYLIVPMWLFTGYFRLPENIHRSFDNCQDKICGCVVIGYRAAPLPTPRPRGASDVSYYDEEFYHPDNQPQDPQLLASAPPPPPPPTSVRSTRNTLSNHEHVVSDDEGEAAVIEYPYARIIDTASIDSNIPVVAVSTIVTGEAVVHPHYYPNDDEERKRDDLENPSRPAITVNDAAFHHSHSDENNHIQSHNSRQQRNHTRSDSRRNHDLDDNHHDNGNGDEGYLIQCFHYIRNIKRRTWLGIFAILLTFLALGGVYELVMRRLQVDFGIPQLFSPSSNLGQALYIVKNYKSSLLTGSSVSDIHIGSYTYSPTKSPALTPPQAAPTNAPLAPIMITSAPTSNSPTMEPSISPSFSPSLLSSSNPSASPTIMPTTASPTKRPNFFSNSPTRPTIQPSAEPSLASTIAPSSQAPTVVMPTAEPSSGQPSSDPTSQPSTAAPTTGTTPSSPSTDYIVTGCWGISTSKQYKDSVVDLTFNVNTFNQYMSSGGLAADMMALCDYVENNRDYLNVNPTWNMSNDCIYQQYIQTSQSLFIRSLPPTEQTVSNTLLYWASQSITAGGLLGVQKNTTAVPLPGFPYALDVTWLCANFSVESAVSSMINNPNLAVTLNSRWQDAFAIQASTQANVYGVATITGSDEFTFPLLASEVLLSIILAVIITVCGFIGLLAIFTKADITVTMFGTYAMLFILAVAFCIHLYVFDYTVDLLDIVVLIAVVGMVVDFPIHYLMTYLRAKNNKAEGNRGEHVERYITFALIAPMLFTVLSGLPLLFADLQLVTKCGQYIVIIAATSFVTTCLILPRMVKLTCCSSIWSACCASLCNFQSIDEGRRRFSSMRSEDTEISEPLLQE